MVGCCGFLSFSLVFCKFGGRLETTLYIHFTRRWVEARRHSSALRRKKRGGEAGKYAILRSADAGLVGWWVRRVGLRQSLCCLDAGQCLGRPGGGRGRRRRRRSVAHAGTETWWRAAAREAVYVTQKGLVRYVKEAEVLSWTDLLKKLGGLQLLQRLAPPLTPPVESKAKPFTRF